MKKNLFILALAFAATCAFAQQDVKGFQCNLDLEGNATSHANLQTTLSNVKDYVSGGLSIDVGMGCRFNKVFYLGAAVSPTSELAFQQVAIEGSDQKASLSMSNWTLPIYGDARLFIPTKTRCYPYLDLGLGGIIGLGGKIELGGENGIEIEKKTTDTLKKNGLYFQAGLGLEFKYFNMGLGYKMHYYENEPLSNYGFVRIGVSLGAPNRK